MAAERFNDCHRAMSAMAAKIAKAQELKAAAGTAFAKKRVRQALKLYIDALDCLRSPPGQNQLQNDGEAASAQQSERHADEGRRSAEYRLLEATLLSNISICCKLRGDVKEGLELANSTLEVLAQSAAERKSEATAAAADTDGHAAAVGKLREKNVQRAQQLAELHEALIEMDRLRDGSADASVVAAADSCSPYRQNLESTLEFCYFGHDNPKSGARQIFFQAAGHNNRDFSAFFGGCGDCRHVFATLLDLVDRVLRGYHPKEEGFRSVHLELNDIHPFVLARFVVVCHMSAEIHDLQSKAPAADPASEEKVRGLAMALQSFAADCFIRRSDWDGIVKPALQRVRAGFEKRAASPSQHGPVDDLSLPWLICDREAATAVVESIDQWFVQEGLHSATAMRDKIKRDAAGALRLARHRLLAGPGMREKLMAQYTMERQSRAMTTHNAAAALAPQQLDTVIVNSVPPEQARAMLRFPVEKKRAVVGNLWLEEQWPSSDPLGTVVNSMVNQAPQSTMDVDILQYVCIESDIATTMQNIVLDIAFWFKYHCYPPAGTKVNPALAAQFRADPSQAVHDFVGTIAPGTPREDIQLGLPDFEFNDDDILWNPAVFDERHYERDGGQGDVGAYAQPLAVTIYRMYVENGFFKVKPHVRDIADLAAQFYGDVGSALALLSQESGDYRPGDRRSGFSIKLSVGDVFEALQTAGRAGQSFDSIYLSNIPDYTGMLPVFSYAPTVLKQFGVLGSNVLLNTGMWPSYADYVYHMAFCDYDEAKTFCQCEYVGDDSPFGTLEWRKADSNWWKEGEVLRKKAAFVEWLRDILLNIAFPSRESDQAKVTPAMKATRPQSLAMFFRLAASWQHPLPRIWHAEVIRDVLNSGELKTKWRHHPVQINPVQLQARKKSQRARKIDVSFAVAELATLAAVFRSPVAYVSPIAQPAEGSKAKSLTSLSADEIYRIRVQQVLALAKDHVYKSDASVGVAILRARPSVLDHREFSTGTLLDIRKALRHGDDPDSPLHPMADERTLGVEVLHLISTCHVDVSVDASVDFLLPCEVWRALRGDEEAFVVLFNYYNWLTVSKPQSMADARATTDLRLGGPISVFTGE